MKVGDLVNFTDRSHSLYRKYSKGPGLIVDIDYIAKYNRMSRHKYLGAKVTDICRAPAGALQISWGKGHSPVPRARQTISRYRIFTTSNLKKGFR